MDVRVERGEVVAWDSNAAASQPLLLLHGIATTPPPTSSDITASSGLLTIGVRVPVVSRGEGGEKQVQIGAVSQFQGGGCHAKTSTASAESD